MKIIKAIVILFLTVVVGYGQKQIEVKGKVKDASNAEAVIGANIVVKGSNVGVITDVDGNFQITASDNATLEVSYVGYLTQEIKVDGRSVIDIDLEVNSRLLDEVVVVGYGTVKKSNVTGSIISVKEEELKTVPVTNIMEALQGKLAGVDITRSSGNPGAGINVLVRGNRSLTASNSPLFIVDGIQYSNIQDLNPNDVQSMEVLKDAASTAIYGSRGANGVIIVTTKKGAKDKTSLSFNAYTGISEVFGYPLVQNAEQYKNQRREANRATGNWTSSADDAKIFGNLLNSPGEYWPELFFQRGRQSDYQLGMSIGSQKTSGYISFGLFNEKGIFQRDDLNRYSLRFNLDHKLSKSITIGTQNQITYYNQDFMTDPMNTANKLVPLEVPYDADGKLIPLLNGNRNVNPLSDLIPGNFDNNQKLTRLFTSAYVGIDILKNLNFRSNLGINLLNRRNGLFAAALTNTRNGAQPIATYRDANGIGLNLENVLNYNLTVGKHNFIVTGVQSLLTDTFEEVTASGTNQLVAKQSFYGLANAPNQISIGANFRESALLSYTGRLMYNFDDRYLLTLTGRSDGASQLSEGNKWAFFPSAAFAWRITQEDFLSDNDVISDLKVRVSYGVAGNSAVDPYSSQTTLTRIPFSWDETPAIGYGLNPQIGNSNLRWEKSTTQNIGVDFGLLKNRITGTLDVFNTDTDDLLLERLLPISSGSSNIIENIGKTQNRGVELSINAVAIDQKDLKWNMTFNWFRVREKILELATASNDVANGWFIGYPTQSFFDYEKLGIWQTSEAETAKTFGQNPGDIKVKDQNGDGKIDATNDRIIIGSNRPDWSGNFSSDLKFGNFDLNVQFFARWGQTISYDFTRNYDPQANENSLLHDYWTPENATNEFPRPNANRSQAATLFYSSLFYRDGSFIKLRGITLGYNLPSALTNKMKMSNARVYLSGRNLWAHTKIENYDTERGGSVGSPMTKLFVGGININF